MATISLQNSLCQMNYCYYSWVHDSYKKSRWLIHNTKGPKKTDHLVTLLPLRTYSLSLVCTICWIVQILLQTGSSLWFVLFLLCSIRHRNASIPRSFGMTSIVRTSSCTSCRLSLLCCSSTVMPESAPRGILVTATIWMWRSPREAVYPYVDSTIHSAIWNVPRMGLVRIMQAGAHKKIMIIEKESIKWQHK